MASLARNFVGLANPSHLRIYELGPGEAPRNLPPRVQPELSGLVWLRVVSPDFFLLVDGPPQQGAPALYAATLGVHSETHTIRFALLQERRVRLDDAGNEVPFLEPRGATLVRLDQYLARDGFLVPHSVRLFTQDPANPEPRFLPKPTSELTLTQRFGSLRSKLVPADFLP
ncbi:MAG: hypothetical protein H6828_11130 [Planctomycetes bacterium]|nr:hypothetical protein [Planctomycetota bacterium]